MFKLLKIELSKLLPYRAFTILFIIYLVSLIFIPFIFEAVDIIRQQAHLVFGYPNVWYFYLVFASVINIALGVIVIIITCNEFNYNTARQSVINGLSRGDFIKGKVALFMSIVVLTTFIFVIMGLISGLIYSKDFNFADVTQKSPYILGFAVHALGTMSLAYFFSMIIRRTGIAVLLFLLWLGPLEAIIRGPLLPSPIDAYLPADNLFNYTIKDSFNLQNFVEPPDWPIVKKLIVSSLYSIAFFIFSYIWIKKRDM